MILRLEKSIKKVPRIGGIYIAINIFFYILLESIIEYGTFLLPIIK